MSKNYWTPSLVNERLKEAALVLRQLPPVRARGYFSVWPTILSDPSETAEQEGQRQKRKFCPSPAAVSRMEETLGWTVGLEPMDAKIVWARAGRKRWKAICAEFGIALSTAGEHWLYALCLIAWRLNGKPFPKNLSRSQLLARVRWERR